MVKKKRYYGWSSKATRPHERLATESFETLLGPDARVVRQQAFMHREYRVDLVFNGDAAHYALPPFLRERAQSRCILIEFESGALRVARIRLMASSLFAAHIHDDASRLSQPQEGIFAHPPMLVVYARRLTSAVRKYLQPTPNAGVWQVNMLGLDLYVVDYSQVPSDSEYGYLRMMYVPDAYNKTDFEQKVHEEIHQALTHAVIPMPILQEYLMSTIHNLFDTEHERANVVRKTILQSYEEGKEDGLERGLERGLHAGRQESLKRAIYALAHSKNVELSTGNKEQIDASADTEQLMRWLLQLGNTSNTKLELE